MSATANGAPSTQARTPLLLLLEVAALTGYGQLAGVRQAGKGAALRARRAQDAPATTRPRAGGHASPEG